jgi:hypothetical protein
LLIEVTKRQHAWRAALLVAERAEQAMVHVSPSVAENLGQWIAVVACSKPAPLLTDLTPRDDAVAEVNVIMRKIYLGTPLSELKVERHKNDEIRLEDWLQSIEDFDRGTSEATRDVLPALKPAVTVSKPPTRFVAPASDQPSTLSADQRRQLHEDLRAALYGSPETRLGLKRLQSALAATSANRHLIAENIIRVCPPNGPMATLVQVLLDQKEHSKTDEFDELELPTEITSKSPRGFGRLEMSQFRTDLGTMASGYSNWRMPLGPVATTRRRRRDEPTVHFKA